MGTEQSSNSFSNFYSYGQLIGLGTFATVKICQRNLDNKRFAVKIIQKKDLTPKELQNIRQEIYITHLLRHDHVISIQDVFEDKKAIKIVLELCEGADLWTNIAVSKNKLFTEPKAAKMTAIIAETLQHMHFLNITHRDLKPDNILFTKDGTLKITDFGSASRGKQFPHLMQTNVGTPFYVAPEVLLNGAYSNKVDVWSLGVILYVMLCGDRPFNIRNKHNICSLYQKILKGQYKFTAHQWQNIDKDAIDLIKSLMCTDPNQRITLNQVINHKWIKKHNKPKK